MKSKIIAIVVLVVTALLITITLIYNKKEINKNNTPIDRSHIPVTVSAATIKKMPSNGELTLPAILEPNESATIAVGAMGELMGLNIELGSKVRKGQVIGKVDTRAMQIQLQSLELTVAKLKADYERNQSLLEGNAISAVNVRDSKYNYESNKLTLEKLRQQIADANIVSPLSGIITDKKMVEGEFVGAGSPIATVVDVSKLKATVYVSESDIYYLKKDQKVTAHSRIFPEKILEGTITYMSPNGDNNHRYKVEITMDGTNENFKAGTYVNVTFHLDVTEDILQLPKAALVNGIVNPYVFIVDGEKAKKRAVVLGREIGDYYGLKEGLKAGDKVITAGKINVIDGSNIAVKK